MNRLEIIAAILGVINVWLIMVRSVWNYPVALLLVALTGIVVWEQHLFSDAGLQVFFFIVNLYGWWAWRANKAQMGEVVVEVMTAPDRLAWLGGTVAASLVWGWMMGRYTTAAYPYWDGAAAMASVVGQILMTRRALENWWWWIAVNMTYVALYWVKGLFWLSGLSVVLLFMAIGGLMQWQRSYQAKAA